MVSECRVNCPRTLGAEGPVLDDLVDTTPDDCTDFSRDDWHAAPVCAACRPDRSSQPAQLPLVTDASWRWTCDRRDIRHRDRLALSATDTTSEAVCRPCRRRTGGCNSWIRGRPSC